MKIREFLDTGRTILMDGAMGTELVRRGASLGWEVLEMWNLTRREDICTIHQSYQDAGAEIALTHTFQANPTALRLAPHDRARLPEIWAAALANTPRPALADVGPLPPREFPAILGFCQGADGVLLETWSNPGNVRRFAILCDLPLLVSFSFNGATLRTFEGATPEQCAATAAVCGAIAVGTNCGAEVGLAELLEIVRRYRAVTDLPIFVRPNAGTPRDGVYPRSPADMAAWAPALVEAGVRMIGGCCGTTPAHIAALRRA